jgi:acyl-CoA thioesterase II
MGPVIGVQPERDGTFSALIPDQGRMRLFGGQVAAQALLAASLTVPRERPVHSLHGYFIRPGRSGAPLRYEVDHVRDGSSFTTRQVKAMQGDRAIFEMLASFSHPEPGADWHPAGPIGAGVPPTPDVHVPPGPLRRFEYMEIRRVNPGSTDGWRIHPYWFRLNPPIGAHPGINAAALTLVSDMALMAGARAPGANEPMSQGASLDHSLWIHRPARLDQWHLFSTEPVANIGTRGLVRGSFHNEDGVLVATVTQEALLRPLHPPGTSWSKN